MKTLRLALAIALTTVVVGGYAASQFIYLRGPDATAQFEAQVNQPQVHLLMLILLIGAVALGFVPDREDEPR
jgi:hypothetical protein